MRVVAGEFGGRRLKAVPGMKTRPTTDKVKESMFNIIGPYLNGGNVLDLFGGSGGLSIEAVSRGADSATLIDRQYQAIKTINENIEVTKSKEKFRIIKGDTNKDIFKLAKESKRFENQAALLKQPVCRNGKTEATVGMCQKIWEGWK